MKVVIYHAKTFKDCSAALMQALSQRPPSPEESNILLVPDKLTLAAESEVLYAAKSRGTFNTFVYSFTKFCTVLGGGERGSYLDKQGSIQLLARLIEQSKGELKWFANAAQREGFAEIVYNTISKLRYCLISPEQIKSYSGGGQLQAKAADIALLYEKYCDYIKDRFFDSCTKLDILYELLDRPDCLKNTHIYLKDFDNFSRQEMRIIKKMMTQAESLSVACTMDRQNHLYKNEIFEGMLSACSQMGVQAVLTDCDKKSDDFAQHIRSNLFSLGNIKKIPHNGRVSLYSAPHAFGEAEAAARYISEGVRKGARYKDFTIVCGIADYRLPLQRAFAQYNIPCFLDEGANLAAHPLGRFLKAVAEAKTEGLTAERGVTIAKSPFGAADCADELENFCLKYNIKSLKKPFTEGKYALSAERARARVEEIVQSLNMPKVGKVEAFVAAVRTFLQNIGAEERLAVLAEEERAAGIESRARVTAQTGEALEEVLKGAERALADFFVEDKSFVKMLCSGMKAVDISVVPMHLDAVYIGEITTSKYHAVKNLIVLGCIEGILPGENKDTGLFSEKNIADLKMKGIDIEPSVTSENAREKFNVYQLMCEPSDAVFLSYPRANCRGQKNKESRLFSDFAKMFDCAEKPVPFEERIFTREQAEILLCDAVRKTFRFEEEYKELSSLYYAIGSPLFEKPYIEKSADVSGLFGKFSCSKIETFYDCPYKHFLTYGIKLRPRDLPDLMPFETGSILHAVAEEYLKKGKTNAEHILDEVLSSGEYKKIQASSNFAVLRKRLLQEAEMLCRSIEEGVQNSDFVPDKALIEYNFDDGEMSGKIDRVDTAGQFVRVIDYKTGKVETSLKDIYTGRRLQLFIYLAAAVKKTGLKPAGAYYFPVNNDFEYAKKDKPSRLVGFSLENVEAVRASDKNDAGEISPRLYTGKNGELCVKTVWNDKTLTEQQMDAVLKYAQDMVEHAKQEIRQGNIVASPYDGACDRCDFDMLCNQTEKQIRKVPALYKKNFGEV